MVRASCATEIDGLLSESVALAKVLEELLTRFPMAEEISVPFHPVYLVPIGVPLTGVQREIKGWRDSLRSRNEKLRFYLTFYGRAQLAVLFPLLGFGSQLNFGHSLRAEQCVFALRREAEVLEHERARVGYEEVPAMTPWGPVMAMLREANNADLVLSVIEASGFTPPKLTDEQSSSHKTKVRALLSWLNDQREEADEHGSRSMLLNIARQMIRLNPEFEARLRDLLRPIGWDFVEGQLVAMDLLSVQDIASVPEAARADLVKAASRFESDPSGAVTSACGAVDTLTRLVYASHSLGKPGDDSFQKRVNRSLKAVNLAVELEEELVELGWDRAKATETAASYTGCFAQAAKVLEALRSNMGDTHGTRKAMESMVLDCIKLAQILSHAHGRYS